MDAIIGAYTIPLSEVAAPPSGTPGYPTDGNPGLLIPATDFPAYHYSGIIIELLSIIRAGGLTPDATVNNQVLQAIGVLIGRVSFQQVAYPSGTLTVPAGVGHIEAILDGGGGGGASAYGINSSGAGGGAGGHLHGVWPVSPEQVLTVAVGAGGISQGNGGTTSLSLGGIVLGSASGGLGALFASSQLSLGALGGTVTAAGSSNVVIAQAGERGSDGQYGTEFYFPGHGAGGFYSGGGPAGFQAGDAATGFGAGGGGAYAVPNGADTVDVWPGGFGQVGRFAYRWLP